MRQTLKLILKGLEVSSVHCMDDSKTRPLRLGLIKRIIKKDRSDLLDQALFLSWTQAEYQDVFRCIDQSQKKSFSVSRHFFAHDLAISNAEKHFKGEDSEHFNRLRECNQEMRQFFRNRSL